VNGVTDHLYTTHVQVITAPLLISTIHKPPQHPLSLFQPTVSLPTIPWQWLLTVEILQFHALRFYLHSLLCTTAYQLTLSLAYNILTASVV
jgi:hypothetical protein